MTRRCRCVGTTHTCGVQSTNPNIVYVGQGGPRGPQGAQGTQGTTGAGTQGAQGTQGLIGPGGGAQGTTGAQGPTGIQGPAGAQGAQGSEGPQGATGTQGETGLQGADGIQGAQGVEGAQGVQGTDGGGVTLQQLAEAIASAALTSTDDLPEGTINLYYTPERVSYFHTQDVASDTWVITHNLGFYPNIVVQDSALSVVEGEITYDSVNQVTLTFQSAFSGKAYLS